MANVRKFLTASKIIYNTAAQYNPPSKHLSYLRATYWQLWLPSAKTKIAVASYKFFRTDAQRWIETQEETWGWEAHYEDGQVLKQFGDDGIFHQFVEIDQSRLAIFKMTSKLHPQTYTLLFSDPDMKLIHFYRNTILNAGTDNEQRHRLCCFGYEKKLGAKVHKIIMIITPNNGLIVTEEPNLL